MTQEIKELEARLFEERLKELCRRAYNQGLDDARSNQSYPPMFKKEDVADYFQVSKASVENIIRMSGFPKSKIVNARYPRDEVIKWANAKENIERVSFLKQAN